MNVNKLSSSDRSRIASEATSLQYLPRAFQRVKYAELCRKYSRVFVCGFYGGLLMRFGGEGVSVRVWDWAATNCAGEEYYKELLDYGFSSPMTTPAGVVEVIENCCMRYAAGRSAADKREAKIRGAN